jgi:hypothetical protein
MRKIVLAALTVLSLGAGVANAQSYSYAAPSHNNATQQGPYDNTANSLGGRYIGGGD